MKKHKKIVFTGAPSSGKTSAIEALGRFSEKIACVPETAALLLSGGYPAPAIGDIAQSRIFQGIILQLQRSLEDIYSLKHPNATHLVLDRAVLDGVGYWPKGPRAFLKEFRIDVDKELHRYDYVVFFDCPEEKFFGGVGQKRFHDYSQSREIGEKQFNIWKTHRNFFRIANHDDFPQKIAQAIEVVKKIIG